MHLRHVGIVAHPADVLLTVRFHIDSRDNFCLGIPAVTLPTERARVRPSGTETPGADLVLFGGYMAPRAGHIDVVGQRLGARDSRVARFALRRCLRWRGIVRVMAGDAWFTRIV